MLGQHRLVNLFERGTRLLVRYDDSKRLYAVLNAIPLIKKPDKEYQMLLGILGINDYSDVFGLGNQAPGALVIHTRTEKVICQIRIHYCA